MLCSQLAMEGIGDPGVTGIGRLPLMRDSDSKHKKYYHCIFI